MADATFSSELIKVFPVVLGGLIALAGGVIGQVITHRLTTKRERTALYREKMEAYVKALYAHSQWLADRHALWVFRKKSHDVPPPLDEADMIQSLYFPELAEETLNVRQAHLPMLQFMVNQRVARLENEDAWLDSYDDTPYNTMCEVYLSTVKVATKKCRAMLTSNGALILPTLATPQQVQEVDQ